MDVRIDQGDLYLTDAGATEYLSAAREAAQRVLIAATTAKGAFRYQRSLGTDYASLGDGAMLREKLDMLIREAAAGVADTQVSVIDADAEHGTATLQIICSGAAITTEVNLNGII